MDQSGKNYKKLIVWQKSLVLVVDIYALTESFPREEIFGLTSQIRRAAVSIPSNIAEGKLRGTEKEFKHFLRIAFGSGGELETQLEIAKQVFPKIKVDYAKVEVNLSEVMKMLNVLIGKASV